MPDIEKVVNGLREMSYRATWKDIDRIRHKFQPIINDAVTLLKEQEAVEARKKNDGKPQPWTSWWYVCGDCGQEIEYHDRFCRWCGRSVKWK